MLVIWKQKSGDSSIFTISPEKKPKTMEQERIDENSPVSGIP